MEAPAENRSPSLGLLRQTFLAAAILASGSVILGAFVTPWRLIIAGFTGTVFITAAVFGQCTLTRLIAKLPFNPSHSGSIKKGSDLLDL